MIIWEIDVTSIISHRVYILLKYLNTKNIIHLVIIEILIYRWLSVMNQTRKDAGMEVIWMSCESGEVWIYKIAAFHEMLNQENFKY
jgi:hypothetical protein